MTLAVTSEALARERPECSPWLSLIAEAQRALDDSSWIRVAPFEPRDPCPVTPAAPLLDGAVLAVDGQGADRFVRCLFETAALAAGPPSLRVVAHAERLDVLAVLEAAVCQDASRLDELGRSLDVPTALFRSIAAVAAMPLLHAGRQALGATVPRGWARGYCPVCGAWPVLAEARGLERSRQLRCARCGGDWRTDWLRCPYCTNADHTTLGSLVGESRLETRTIETCEACRGYVKTLTTLRPTPPDAVVLLDLATVELDIVAMERGYARPPEPTRALGTQVVTA